MYIATAVCMFLIGLLATRVAVRNYIICKLYMYKDRHQ